MSMHPFHWVPAAGERHVTCESRPPGGYATGATVPTLCRQELAADNSLTAWFWATCPTCNAEAHRLAGVPVVPTDHH